MKDFVLKLKGAALAIAALVALMLPSDGALAQVVTQLPLNVNNAAVLDMGNGPLELRIVQGNMLLTTSQGSGVGSGSTTAITLTATPTTPPCIGCLVSGIGVTSGTTVTAYNGTTGITTNTSQTIAASTALSWGAACPGSLAGFPVVPLQAAVGGDVPLYTQARICAGALSSPGASMLIFPIGAH